MGWKLWGAPPSAPPPELDAVDDLRLRVEDLQDAVVGLQYKLDVCVALLSALLNEVRDRPDQQPMIVVPRQMMGEARD